MSQVAVPLRQVVLHLFYHTLTNYTNTNLEGIIVLANTAVSFNPHISATQVHWESKIHVKVSINISGLSRSCHLSVGFTQSVGFPWRCLWRTHLLEYSTVRWAASWRGRWISCRLDMCPGIRATKDRKVCAGLSLCSSLQTSALIYEKTFWILSV